MAKLLREASESDGVRQDGQQCASSFGEATTTDGRKSGQHGEPRRGRPWWWVLVVAATMTSCVVGIAWVIKQQPSGVNTRNRWSDFVRARGKLRPPAPRTDQGLGSTGSEVEQECADMRASWDILPIEDRGKAGIADQQRWDFLGCNGALNGVDYPVRGRKMVEGDISAELGVVAVATAAAAAEAEASAANMPPLATRTLAEPEATEATVREENGQVQQLQPEVQAKVEVEMEEAGDVDKSSVLLVIAVVTIRSDRRAAVRNSWLAWGDDRVVLRFFTEAPDESQPEGQAYARELEEESAAYGDLVLLNIEGGMNFAVKLLSAMKYVSGQYNFDFFLRLDDDYFLCLHLLLDELESVKNAALVGGTMESLMLYAGFRYCFDKFTHSDEAYMLLSSALVHRVLSIKELHCSRHAGISAGSWFTVGHDANKHGDVRWVHDPRLDHLGDWWKPVLEGGAAPSAYAHVCEAHIGVHRTYPEQIATLWNATKHVTAQQLLEGKEARGGDMAEFRYLADEECAFTVKGVDYQHFKKDGIQPCETFHASKKMWCGKEGC